MCECKGSLGDFFRGKIFGDIRVDVFGDTFGDTFGDILGDTFGDVLGDTFGDILGDSLFIGVVLSSLVDPNPDPDGTRAKRSSHL